MSDEITWGEIRAWILGMLKSKIFWIGIFTIMAGIVEYLMGVPAGASYGTIAIGIINIIIRFFTHSSLKEK